MSFVVYTLHKVLSLPRGETERGAVDKRSFTRTLRWLRRLGVDFVALGELRTWLEGKGRTPGRRAALTFDDGYRSAAQNAFPLLLEEGIPFALFIVPELMGRKSDMYAHKGGRPAEHLDRDPAYISSFQGDRYS